MEESRNELLPGTLDLLILSTLHAGPAHGYTIMEAIWSQSGELFRVEEGALYPALHRLEVRGLLSSDWGLSEAKRRAKFYNLTKEGYARFAQERANWDRIAIGMRRILRASGSQS
jgi:PadR family transcriptional regulator PadR